MSIYIYMRLSSVGSILQRLLTSSADAAPIDFPPYNRHMHSELNLRQRPYQLTCWLTRRWTSASMLVVLGCSRRGSLLLGRGREATAEILRACGQPRYRRGGGGGGLGGLPFGGVQMVPLQLWRHEGDTETECSARIKRQNGGLGGDR